MKLKEMSFQYREGAKACRARANELKEALWQCTGETEKMLLRRRIAILTRMANEAAATAKYLYNYYGGRDENDYDGSGKVSGNVGFVQTNMAKAKTTLLDTSSDKTSELVVMFRSYGNKTVANNIVAVYINGVGDKSYSNISGTTQTFINECIIKRLT